MPNEPLYPLRFRPILKRLIWGGRRLGSLYGKPLGPEADYAESWEISDHRDDVSVVADGPLAGTNLRDLLANRGAELLGPALGNLGQFPLLVKLLDAHQVLSAQVHPDDEKGRVLAGDNGKTEAWVILHAEPGSLIYAGLRPGVSRDEFASAMEDGKVEPLFHRFEPAAGDCLLIPAGTVHAIGAGIVLAEVQQMSDATFRIHDWDRPGPDGKPRPLHKREALESIDFTRGPVAPIRPRSEAIPRGTRERLARCEYFAIDRLLLNGPSPIGSPDRFTIVLNLGDEADIAYRGEIYPIARGEARLLPASLGTCDLHPRDEATILSCEVP